MTRAKRRVICCRKKGGDAQTACLCQVPRNIPARRSCTLLQCMWACWRVMSPTKRICGHLFCRWLEHEGW